MGALNYDDFLYVNSEDGTVTKIYYIEFMEEPAGFQNEIRTLCPDPSNLMANISGTDFILDWDYDDSGLEFGFVILRDGVAIDTIPFTTYTDKDLVIGETYQYSVYAFNEFGNSGDITLNVIMTSSTSIDKPNIQIYPSVTRDKVYFTNLPENSQMMLSDLSGRTLLIIRDARQLQDGLSLQSYADGMYLIRLISGNEFLKSVKIIKMQ